MRPIQKGNNLDVKDVILDVKDFTVYGDIIDDMVLSSYVNCHGEVIAGNALKSQSWHGKELKMCGDFVTYFKARVNDPVISINIASIT
jgi:hypothetical protein